MAVSSLECRFEVTTNETASDRIAKIRQLLANAPLNYKFDNGNIGRRPKAEVVITNHIDYVVVNFKMVADGSKSKNPNFNSQSKLLENALDKSSVDLSPIVLTVQEQYKDIAERLIVEYLTKVSQFEISVNSITKNMELSKGRVSFELEANSEAITLYPSISDGKGKTPNIEGLVNIITLLIKQLH